MALKRSRAYRGGKRRGQSGHKGDTIKMSSHVDDFQLCAPKRCGCGKRLLRQAMEIHARRQVFDIPDPKLLVTEYQQLSCCCPDCGRFNLGQFPDQVKAPVQYGSGVQALVSLLHVKCQLSYYNLNKSIIYPIVIILTACCSSSIDKAGKETTENWYEALPACPCQNPDLNGLKLNDGWAIDDGEIAKYHAGANICFRSYPYVVTSVGKSGQQCCYDVEGKLITGGSGAGTPDKVSTCKGEKIDGHMNIRIGGLYGHYFNDVRPWQQQGGTNGGWNKYNLFHPPNNALNCSENIVCDHG